MKIRILMVCLGNICRSPLAEGILKSKMDPNLFFIDSAGTAGYHIGKNPDIRSIEVAKKYGIDISGQRSRKCTHQDLENFDILYAMDLENYQHLMEMATNEMQSAKVKLLPEAANLPIQEVPDPYYGGDEAFEEVFQILNNACSAISNQLKQE